MSTTIYDHYIKAYYLLFLKKKMTCKPSIVINKYMFVVFRKEDEHDSFQMHIYKKKRLIELIVFDAILFFSYKKKATEEDRKTNDIK